MVSRRSLFAAPLLLPVAGRAQAAWPAKPVRVVVPYPAGGSTDVLARAVAERLGALIGGPGFVVENRGGGAAVVGTVAVAQAPPDGYTLSLATNQTHAANAAMLKDLPYRPVEDFAPIGRIAEVHHALVVPATSPAKTLAELAARGRGQRLIYASSGVGSASHVIGETFVKRAGIEATHVPYRGGAQATTDTVSGVVDFFVSTWPQVVELVKDGRLRCLEVGAPARLAEVPAVPTAAEAGAPWLAVDAWFGLWAPAGTPASIVARLSQGLQQILAEPALVAQLRHIGFNAAPMPAAAFGAFQRAELARWQDMVEMTGIRIEG